jgi:lysophospholipase L1-like esterase
VWSLNNWNINELSFLVLAGHPFSSPEDSDLVSYRAALKDLSSRKYNLTTLDLSDYISYSEMQEKLYYNTPSDTAHLSNSGYEALSSLIFSSL